MIDLLLLTTYNYDVSTAGEDLPERMVSTMPDMEEYASGLVATGYFVSPLPALYLEVTHQTLNDHNPITHGMYLALELLHDEYGVEDGTQVYWVLVVIWCLFLLYVFVIGPAFGQVTTKKRRRRRATATRQPTPPIAPAAPAAPVRPARPARPAAPARPARPARPATAAKPVARRTTALPGSVTPIRDRQQATGGVKLTKDLSADGQQGDRQARE
jgi:hypothetical protein